MPTICRFYGLVIRMYFLGQEHDPPHIHVIYGEDVGVFKIEDGSLIRGDLPKHAIDMTQIWIEKNKKELLNMWATQEFKKLRPLK